MSGKVRINIVGHGKDVRAKDVNKMGDLVSNIHTGIKKSDPNATLGKVGLVACGSCLNNQGKPYGAKLTETLNKKGLQPEVTERTAQIQVNADGTKTAHDTTGKTPQKRTYKIVDGKLQTHTKDAKRAMDAKHPKHACLLIVKSNNRNMYIKIGSIAIISYIIFYHVKRI